MPDINFFAKTNFRNQERVFGIKRDDRRRHMYVIGKTGMGKSNLLENMAIQDIRNGEGVCVVDPHGEFAEKMLKSVPSHRMNDIIYFNPSDADFPVAFNILESVDDDKKNLVASGMMGVFKKIWPDVWSARMEYILNNTILALLDYPGSTMLGINRMMNDKDYRKRVYTKIKDPVVKSFWVNEFDKWEDKFRKEAVAAIQNKVGQFLSSSVIRHIVGQAKSTINMGEIMDSQKILIVNLSKGRIGEDSMRLLGGMIITKIQLAAMGRVNIPEHDRKDFYLYVDEFQNFANESFANILSEARKYRLNLILAHQYINQLVFDGNSTVRDAVFGNVGSILSFRVGAEDAEHLEKEFEPIFMMNDIVNLTKYNIYLKLMIDGVAGDAFSATTLPPLDLSDTIGNEEKIINITRERYSKPKSEVEDRIARWSGMEVFKEIPIGENEKINDMDNDNDSYNPQPSPVEHRIIREKEVFSKASAPESRTSQGEMRRVAPQSLNVANTASLQAGRPQSVAVSQPKNESVVTENKADVPKETFTAVCATCEETITVPFKPDPSRPAFCRECLKEHQRMVARKKAEMESQPQSAPQQSYAPRSQVSAAPAPAERRIVSEPQVVPYGSKEKPLSLSQMSHIAPKKFKMQKQRPNVDLAGLRASIDEAKKEE